MRRFAALLASWCFALALGAAPMRTGSAAAGLPEKLSGIVQTAQLDPSRPLFVPTHTRVATTIRFPGPIGAPEGRGFTEDEMRSPGEYLVTWTPGDAHLTLTPLPGAGPANLNVPYQGLTYVFYFYPAESQFHALASLSLMGPPRTSPAVAELAAGPAAPAAPSKSVPGTPSRWLGMLDKIKVLRAAAPGPATMRMAEGFGLTVWEPASGDPRSISDHGRFRIRLMRVARDDRLNCVAFAVRIENASDHELVIDVSSFSARVGRVRLAQAASDAPVRLRPHAVGEACFVAPCPSLARLLPENPWLVSVALAGDRENPCGALIAAFASQRRKTGGVR